MEIFNLLAEWIAFAIGKRQSVESRFYAES